MRKNLSISSFLWIRWWNVLELISFWFSCVFFAGDGHRGLVDSEPPVQTGAPDIQRRRIGSVAGAGQTASRRRCSIDADADRASSSSSTNTTTTGRRRCPKFRRRIASRTGASSGTQRLLISGIISMKRGRPSVSLFAPKWTAST